MKSFSMPAKPVVLFGAPSRQWQITSKYSDFKSDIAPQYGYIGVGSLRPSHWPKVQRHISNVAGVNHAVAVHVAE